MYTDTDMHMCSYIHKDIYTYIHTYMTRGLGCSSPKGIFVRINKRRPESAQADARNPTSGPAHGPLSRNAVVLDTIGLLRESRGGLAGIAVFLVGIAGFRCGIWGSSCGIWRPFKIS